MSRRTRARFRAGSFVVGTLLLSSCGGKVTQPPPPIPVCADSVTITVSPGMVPAFSWTPDCLIGRLIVEEMPDDERWGVEMNGENTFRSPITYSVPPPGTPEPEPGTPLSPGVTYTVTLFRWFTFLPEESLVVVGRARFTPLPECTDSVTVTVSPGMTPVFSWTPNCMIGGLIVEKQPGDEPWRTQMDGENTYRSPITYGVSPPGTPDPRPATPLTPGETYSVTLFRWTAYPESLRVLANVPFTPDTVGVRP